MNGRMRRLALCGALTLGVAACSDSVTMPDAGTDPSASRERAGSPALTAMTYNVYVGASIEGVLQIQDPAQIPGAVAAAFAQVQQTNFPERAAAIVDQIERTRPDVIGLQEVSRFEIPTQAFVLDYEAILLAELASRGLGYTRAAGSANFTLVAPLFDPTTQSIVPIILTDHDLVLVRDDVPWSNPMDARYETHLTVTLAGQDIDIERGYASVDVMVKGLPYRVISTHLEPADDQGTLIPALEPIQLEQTAELVAFAASSPIPVVLLGDLNTAADGETTATYQMLTDAGFVDAWLVGRPRGDGFTSNQAADLLNPVSQLFHRIDFVFIGPELTNPEGRFQGSVHAERVGEEQADRTPSGLWPSDHAGVVAQLRIAPGVGLP